MGESCSWLSMVWRNGVKAERPRWAQLACTSPWGAEAGVHLSLRESLRHSQGSGSSCPGTTLAWAAEPLERLGMQDGTGPATACSVHWGLPAALGDGAAGNHARLLPRAALALMALPRYLSCFTAATGVPAPLRCASGRGGQAGSRAGQQGSAPAGEEVQGLKSAASPLLPACTALCRLVFCAGLSAVARNVWRGGADRAALQRGGLHKTRMLRGMLGESR